MGTFGLWKYVSSHNVAQQADAKVPKPIEHLFLDMNGIMHMSYTKQAPTAQATIKNILALVQKLIHLYPPSQSLVLVFDGTAPTSKLRTQRERRQTMIRSPEKVELNEAQIVTGSTFVLHVEEEVEKFVREGLASGKLCGELTSGLSNVIIIGSRVPGEGETKIGQEIRALYSSQVARGSYSSADRFVIVGNDSDLILTCIAATPYHNFFLVNPYTFVATCVGELMTHWVNAVPNRQLLLEHLPSFRMDFVFLMLLAGGDHFPGIEEDAVFLWRKYRKLRADGGFFRQSLIRGDEINWEFLRQVVAKDHGHMQHYTGSKNKRQTVKSHGSSAPAEPGFQLLRGARWALNMVAGNECSDYFFHFRGEQAKIGNLRAALNSGGLQSNSKVVVSPALPLKPLQVYCAVMGALQFLPKPVQNILEVRGLNIKFATTLSVGTILSIIQDVFEVYDDKLLTKREKLLTEFGERVILVNSATDSSSVDSERLASRSTLLTAIPNFQYPDDVVEITFLNLYDSRYVKLAKLTPKKAPIAVHVDPAAESDVPALSIEPEASK